MDHTYFTPASLHTGPIASTGISKELEQLLASLATVRGSIANWSEMSNALGVYTAQLPPATRVWCRGEVHAPGKHYPAILVYDSDANKITALAPSGVDHAVEEHPPHLFWSSIPHIALAREVYNKDSGVSTL